MSIVVKKMSPLLQVFDMPATLRFYRDVLGFEVVQTSGEEGDNVWWAMVRLGEAMLMFNTAYETDKRPDAPDPVRVTGHGDTILYFDSPDVDATYAYLVEQGVAVKPPEASHYGAKQLYVKDPDGYSLCFQWYAAQNP